MKRPERRIQMQAPNYFKANLAIYVVINLLLAVINFVHTPKYVWFHFPLLGWGCMIAVLYLVGVRWPALQRSGHRRIRRGFEIHLAVYLIVNAMLLITNLMYAPQLFWVVYIILGWGSGLAAHYFFFK
ncbi:MAG: 2TM domain-containing protein [Oligoflexales bacterium]|nr:2TM domain-containing protein [Oligoflexales bacterium]